MKRRAVFLWFVVITLLVPSLYSSASAAASKVKVSIPKFSVEINGNKMDNLRALYPPVVYKDVVYLPMTSNVASALGLYIQRDHKTGLWIQSGAVRKPLQDDLKGKNGLNQSYTAQVAAFPIKVNEEKVKHSSQKYPFLIFRDITYFPMTQHFTHELFKWDTEWKAKTAFKIRSSQVPVLYDIMDDDAKYLYVNTGTEGILKVSKALDGKYSRLSDEESRTVIAKYESQAQQYAMPQGEDTNGNITSDGETIYYKNQALISLKPYYSNSDPESGIEQRVNLIKIDDDNSFLTLTVFYRLDIPAPYTPHVNKVFVIHQQKATEIAGYTQMPNKLIKNADGSFWVSSFAPLSHDMTAADFDVRAQLALIEKNGKSHNINQLLKAEDIDLKYAGNPLVIRVSNDRFPKTAAKSNGLYTIDSKLAATKISDNSPGVAYIGLNRQIFAMDPNKNSITNLTTKKSHRWWDFELRPDLLH